MFHVIYHDPGNEGEHAAFDQHEPWATTRKGIIQHRRFNTGSDGGDLCWYRFWVVSRRLFSRGFVVVSPGASSASSANRSAYGQAMHRPRAPRIRGRRAPVLEMRGSVDTHHPGYGIHGTRRAGCFPSFLRPLTGPSTSRSRPSTSSSPRWYTRPGSHRVSRLRSIFPLFPVSAMAPTRCTYSAHARALGARRIPLQGTSDRRADRSRRAERRRRPDRILRRRRRADRSRRPDRSRMHRRAKRLRRATAVPASTQSALFSTRSTCSPRMSTSTQPSFPIAHARSLSTPHSRTRCT